MGIEIHGGPRKDRPPGLGALFRNWFSRDEPFVAPLFGSVGRCPKCQLKEASFYEARYCDTPFICKSLPEHMHRGCKCGYKWVEHCADYKEKV